MIMIPVQPEQNPIALNAGLKEHALVLLIEDNADDVSFTMRAFTEHAIELEDVAVARDGREAIDYLFARGEYEHRNRSIMPKLIVLDMDLPKEHGIDVLKTLRNNPRTKHIPVIVLSSSTEERDVVASYTYGANSYIQKPFGTAEFSKVIQQITAYWLGINVTPEW